MPETRPPRYGLAIPKRGLFSSLVAAPGLPRKHFSHGAPQLPGRPREAPRPRPERHRASPTSLCLNPTGAWQQAIDHGPLNVREQQRLLDGTRLRVNSLIPHRPASWSRCCQQSSPGWPTSLALVLSISAWSQARYVSSLTPWIWGLDHLGTVRTPERGENACEGDPALLQGRQSGRS
jgi:hypothetical protein